MENRAYKRVDVDVPVQIKVPEGMCSARTINVSAGGIAVGTEELHTLVPEGRSVYDLLPHGRVVTLSLVLPSGAPFECTARVRWAVGIERFGGEFVDVSSESRTALCAFLETHDARPDSAPCDGQG